MREYNFDTQIDIVYACMAFHNFIRIYQSLPDKYDEFEHGDDENDDNDQDEVDDNAEDNVQVNNVRLWRNQIAEAMWIDYQAHLWNRNIAEDL